MTDTSGSAGESGRDMRPIYVRVILVELLVLGGLWLFGWYFGR